MNQEPLDQMIRKAVDESRRAGLSDPSAIVERVLADSEVALLMKGVNAHDRAEGLEDVYRRDIRQKVERYLAEKL